MNITGKWGTAFCKLCHQSFQRNAANHTSCPKCQRKSLIVAKADAPVRVLMADSEWLVPKKRRPRVPPPPREWTRAEIQVEAMLSSVRSL